MPLVSLLDVGSTAVNGVLVLSEEKRIVFSTRVVVPLQEQLNSDRFLSDVAQAVKETMRQLVQVGNAVPKNTYCFLSAPFYASRTSIISKRENEPFVYSKKLVDSLVAGATQDFPGHEVLESSVLDVALNGYHVDVPYGQKAKEIEISHYLSIASKPVIDIIRQSIVSVIHSRPLQFHSFAFAFFRVLDRLTPPGQSYLALEFNGELSELSLVWKDLLRETVSFPLGENWLIRELTKSLQTTPAELYSTLRANFDGHLSQIAKDNLNKTLIKLRPEWLEAFRGALNKALVNSFLPGKIFVLGDPTLLPIIKSWLEDESWNNIVLGDSKLFVKPLDSATLEPLCGKISGTNDISTLVEIAFYDIILNHVPRH